MLFENSVSSGNNWTFYGKRGQAEIGMNEEQTKRTIGQHDLLDIDISKPPIHENL